MSGEFVKVADTKDIQAGQMKAIDLAGEQVCIVNVDGNYYAIGNICTHEGGPLNEGMLDGYEVECPWHGAHFDIRTGKVLAPPAQKPVPSYDIRIEANNILIKKRK